MKFLTRTIWIVSLVSLFTDMASEMLYPVMPVYLRSVGFSVLLIGMLEGIAEATAGLSKGYFGKLSDSSGRRAPFVQLGYSLSAISKPLMAAFTNVGWIFFSRTLDRFGKGIRTGARDAILSDETTPENKGKVFGFHRAADTTGAVLGPLLALCYLYFYPENYKALFYLAFIPGLLAVITSLLLKDKREAPRDRKSVSFFSAFRYWKESSSSYKKVVGGLLLFTLFNSSDVFLLLKLKETGLSDYYVIGAYIFYNVVYALASYPLGALSDRLGPKTVLILGFSLYATVYFGMSVAGSLEWYLVLFFVYGLYAAATEGISKAWISNICEKKDTATAIGSFSGYQSICALLASSIAGFLWYEFNPSATFIVTGIVTVLVALYFAFLQVKKTEKQV